MNRSLEEIALELLERFRQAQITMIAERSSEDIDEIKHRVEYEVDLYREAIEIASRREEND